MKKVWKFALTVDGLQKLVMPKGAQILTVQNQYGLPCLWALVDMNERDEIRYIEVYGTGHEINDGMGSDRVYITTVQFGGGDLAWHFFEYTGI